MADKHIHNVSEDWWQEQPHPKKFTAENSMTCPVCGRIVGYSFKGMSYISADYWSAFDLRYGAIKAAADALNGVQAAGNGTEGGE